MANAIKVAPRQNIASPAAAAPRPKAAPTPAQQAAREKFTAITRRATSSAPVASSAPRKPAPLAPRQRTERDGLTKVLGSEAPALVASATLAAVDESPLGERCRDLITVEPSTVAFGLAVALKATGLTNHLGSTVDKATIGVVKSGSHNFSRQIGKGFVRVFAKKSEAAKTETSGASETKTETKPSEDKTIEVKEKTSANGAASHANAPKVTHEKNPSANA